MTLQRSSNNPLRSVRGGIQDHQVTRVSTLLFQGGYLGFTKEKIAHIERVYGPPRIYMLEDLCFYFQHRSELLNGFADPKTVSAFMKKIAAFHYLKLIDYLRAMIAERELLLLQHDSVRGLPADWVEQQWSDLQAIPCTVVGRRGVARARPQPKQHYQHLVYINTTARNKAFNDKDCVLLTVYLSLLVGLKKKAPPQPKPIG